MYGGKKTFRRDLCILTIGKSKLRLNYFIETFKNKFNSLNEAEKSLNQCTYLCKKKCYSDDETFFGVVDSDFQVIISIRPPPPLSVPKN